MVKSSKKDQKPYPDFPLTSHPTGQWCKKIKGRLYYFGTDADAALRKYLDNRDAIQAGRAPETYNPDGCTLREAVNSFLTAKQRMVDAGELSPLTFADYHKTCERILSHFGKLRSLSSLGPRELEGFRAELAKNLGPTSVGDYVRRSRVLFKYAYDAELIDKPLRYGSSFSEPSRRSIRRDRQAKQQQHGLRMFEAAELRNLLKSAGQPLHAAILLGINCGFGATDIATLPKRCLDLDSGWLEFPRPKTSVDRRIPLWPETVTSLKEVLPLRPAAAQKDDDHLCFLTTNGTRFVRPVGRSRLDVLARNYDNLLRKLKLKRPGLSFYALRHTFETIAGETQDQVAVDAIMGHIDDSMAGRYRQRISDDRLIAVTEHVRKWLHRKTRTLR